MARRAAREIYFVKSGSDGLRSFWAFDFRPADAEGSGDLGAGSSSDIKGRPANARGADSLEIMFSKVL